MTSHPVMLYDGACGFCTRAARLAARLPTHAEILPWQDAELERLGTNPERAAHELLWVEPGGLVHGGAVAVACLLGDSGFPWRVLGRLLRLPGARHLAAAGYRFVARHRGRFPGTTPACELPPGQRRFRPRR